MFKLGDLVVWNYAPCDPSGPYEYLVNHNGWGVHDTIEDSLLQYEPPPYEIVRILPCEVVARSVNVCPIVALSDIGHPQIVGVLMTNKANADVDIHEFSGKLFKKVSILLAPLMRRKYRRLGDKLYLKYRP